MFLKLLRKTWKENYFLILLLMITLLMYQFILDIITYNCMLENDNVVLASISDYLKAIIMSKEYLLLCIGIQISYIKLYYYFVQKQVKLLSILLIQGCTSFFINLYLTVEILIINLGAFFVSSILYWQFLKKVVGIQFFELNLVMPSVLMVLLCNSILLVWIIRKLFKNSSICRLYEN